MHIVYPSGKSSLVVWFAAVTLATSACKKAPQPEPTRAPATTTEPAADAATTAEPTAEAKPDAAAEAEKKVVPITTTSPDALKSFESGFELMYHARTEEALAAFKKALELDPEFYYAQVYVGFLTPTADGVAMADKAVAGAQSLSETERTAIETLAAVRKGDTKKAWDLSVKLTELAPDDWRAFFDLGQRAMGAGDHERGLEALKRAAELNPGHAGLQNQIGYAYFVAGKKDEAIAAFKRYVELAPEEPNPHDSLGEALLGAGKLAEAEASFLRATAIDPKFLLAWGGVAACRALAGNWTGALEAIGKLEASGVADDRYDGAFQHAWLLAAQGDVAGAMETLATLEKTAATDGALTTATFAALVRARIQIEEDQLDGVDAAFASAAAHGDKEGWAGSGLVAAKRVSVGLRALVAARQNKADEANALLGEFEALVEAAGKNASAETLSHHIHGRIRMQTDPKAAADELAKCDKLDALCHRAEIAAREKAGDKEGAEAVKKALIETPTRDMAYVYARAKLGTIPAGTDKPE